MISKEENKIKIVPKIFFILWIKEIKENFSSSGLYILSGLFSFVMGGLFYNYISLTKDLTSGNLSTNVLRPLFGNMNFIFLFIAPIITMRSFIEERRNGTLDLLYLAGVNDTQVILAKFFSAFTVVVFMLLPTLLFPIILAASGHQDWGIVATSYLGTLLSVACYLSVGLFSSSASDNQIIAALLSFTILIVLMLLVVFAQASNNYLVAQMVSYLSVPFHFEGFVRGLVKSYNIVYYFSFVSVFLYLSQKTLEARKS